jgi:hypothetical protein
VARQRRIISAHPAALASIDSWLAQQRRHWAAAFDRLEAVAAEQVPARRKS